MIPPGYGKYEKYVSLACVNFQAKWGDKEANLEKIERMTEEAAHLGANIVLFPELCLSGFECPDPCTMHQELAETVPGPTTLRLLELAKHLGIYLIISLPERDREKPQDLYITNVLLGSEGLVGAYRKLSFSLGTKCFKAGNRLPIFDTRYGPVGLITCSNLWLFPEFSRVFALKGARLILNSTASPKDRPAKAYYLVQQTGARGTENGVYVASANLVGTEIKTSYYGHSCIAGPAQPRIANVYAEAGEEEEIINAVLSFERLHEFRKSLRFRYGLPLQIVLDELQSIGAHWHETDSIYPNEPLTELIEKPIRV